MTTLRGISLDLDGTLYAVPRLRVAWRLRHERGLLLALVAAREKMRHEGAFADYAALEAREVELVAPSFGLPLEQAAERLGRLRALLPAALTQGIQPYPGVKSALLAAHARGLKLAVLSDYDPKEKLAHLGLDDVPFNVVVGADTLGALKPHPRSFHWVAERMECRPGEVLHVGDREDLDVEGALQAGLRAWRYSRKSGVATKAERVFSAWSMAMFTEDSRSIAKADQT